MNEIAMAGRIATDIDKIAVGDTEKVNFRIAVDAGKDKADFFSVEAWGKTAELIAEYYSKGRFILFSGRLSQNTWEKNGEKKEKIIVVVNRLTFTPKDDGGGGGKPQRAAKPVEDDDDDIF